MRRAQNTDISLHTRGERERKERRRDRPSKKKKKMEAPSGHNPSLLWKWRKIKMGRWPSWGALLVKLLSIVFSFADKQRIIIKSLFNKKKKKVFSMWVCSFNVNWITVGGVCVVVYRRPLRPVSITQAADKESATVTASDARARPPLSQLNWCTFKTHMKQPT